MLSGNVVAGMMNINMGSVLNFIEGMAGHHMDKKSWLAAHTNYAADLPQIMADIGRDERRSLTNQLVDKFDGMNDFDGPRHNYSNNSWWKRQMESSTLFFINNAGEHFLQSVTMLGVLGKIRVLDSNKNYLSIEKTEDGFTSSTTERQNSSSLVDAHKADDINLSMSEDVAFIEMDGRILEWNEDTQFLVTQKIRHVQELMHGAYSRQNRNDAQRYVLGRMAFMMRKWIEPGLRRRWKGFSRIVGRDKAERRRGTGPDFHVWNYQLGDFEEGTYTSTVSFLFRLWVWDEIKTFQFDIASKWHKMNDLEKANVKKTILDVGFIVAATAFGTAMEALAKDADDDEANKYYFLAYQGHRLYTELFFYANPVEALQLLRSPAASISTLEAITQFMLQFFLNPTEKYIRGRREGQFKLQKKGERIFPWYRQWDRLTNMDEALSFFNWQSN